MDRAELIIKLTGDKEALSSLGNLEKAMKTLENKRVQLRIDKSLVDREIAAVRSELTQLTREKHQIKLDADRAREIDNQIAQLRIDLQALNNLRTKLHLEGADPEVIKALSKDILAVRNEITRLSQERLEIRVADSSEILELDRRIQELREELDALTSEKRSLGLDIADYTNAIAAVKEGMDSVDPDDIADGFEEAAQAAADFLNTLSSVFSGLSSISQATADFADSIGNAFSAMAGAFDTNLFDYMQRKLTYMFTEGLVGDFGRITQRYDIMSTFTQYMEAAGVASDESAAALQRVNDAILGLPIGLDEAAYRLRRYQMFLGDINDATSLTIGLQNALLAGGASEQMRNTAYQQIDRLLSAGKLNTSRQWLALIQGLGVSLKYVTQEMGVSNMTTREFAAGLTSGRISTNEFLRALMNLGNGTSQAARELDGLLEIYKTTLESWLSNIRFAAVRGGETILKSLNQGLMDSTDMGIVDYLKMIRDAMNDFYRGTGEFITGNPELIRQMSDSIGGLMDAFSRFSASDTATMVFNNLTRGIDLLTQALNMLPVDETQQFFAFAVTLAGPLGKLFDVVSSGAPYMLAVFERFKDFDFEHLLERIIEEVDRLASVYERLLNILGDDAMTELITYGLVYGKPAAAGFGAIADALSKLAFAAMGLSALKDGVLSFAGLKTAIAGLPTLISRVGTALSTLAGPIAAIVAAIGVMQNFADAETQNFRQPYGFANRMSPDELKKWIEDAEKQYASMQREYRLQSSEMALPGEDEDLGYKMRALGQDIEEAKGVLDSMGPSASDAATGLDDFAQAANNATEATKNAADTAQTYESRLVELRDRMSLAGEEIEKLLNQQIDVFTKFEEITSRPVKGDDGLTAAIQSNNEALEAYQKNLQKAAEFIAEHPELGTSASELFQEVSLGGIESADILAGLVESFETDYDGFLTYLEDYIKNSELKVETADWAKVLAAGFDPEEIGIILGEDFGVAIAGALERVPDIVSEKLSTDAMRDEMFAMRNGGSPRSSGLSEQLKEVGKQAGSAMAEGMAEGAAEADMTEVGHAAAENAVNATTAALQEADYTPIAATISEKLTEALTAAFTDANLLGVIFNLEDLTALQEAFVLLTETLTTFTVESILPFNEQVTLTNEGLTVLYTDAMLPVEELTVLFYETHLPELNTSLLELIAAITELISALDELITRLEDARRRTDDLRNAVRDLGNTIQSKIPVVYEFSGAINGITSAAQEAAAAVAELAAAIASLESAEITVGAHVAGTTQAAGPRALPFSNGGPVYLARGGVFKPRGTDTVPAMLTPGEFVMNRSAVKAFGLDFMKRINSIDFGAAVQAMYRRMPTMASFVPIYNVQNRNDNRNITVNQSIYDSGEQYSYRVANRWAHAL